MVYRGRPSTGCLKCRQRKIKCDETPDGCVKCAERGFVCPGYENSLDRIFHDESAQVKVKAQRAKAKALALREKRDQTSRTSNSEISIAKLRQSIGVPLMLPLVDQGISYFVSNYALGFDQPPIQSALYHRHLGTHGFHPIIATSMTALGLSGISNIYMDPNFKKEAMRWYLKALHMTNDALASPTEVKSDNTLFATMLLSMFEATNNDQTLSGWSSHVDGSASLLKMRGPDQFSTPSGRRMYMQTVSLLTMNCMGKHEPLPDYIHAMNKEIRRHQDRNDPSNKLYHLHIDAVDFRAQILRGEITDLEDIIDRALEIDDVAKAVFVDVQSDWQFEEVSVQEELAGVFGDSYHIYPNMATAQTWNWVRYNRIYLHDIIRNSLTAGFSMSPPAFAGARYTRLLDESTQTLYRMQAGILASIPQFLHDTPKTMPYASNYPTPVSLDDSACNSVSPPPSFEPKKPKFIWSNFCDPRQSHQFVTPAVSEDRIPIIRMSGGYSSIWALYIAGSMSIATPETQQYVIRSFDRIATEFGINQAKVLNGALRLKIQLVRAGLSRFEIAPEYLPHTGDHLADWNEHFGEDFNENYTSL